MMRLYIGNLPYDLSEKELREAFEPHGQVASAAVISDKFTGRSRGFGFVEFSNDAEGQTAIQAMDGAQLKGRTLKVNEARPRSEGDRGDRGGGGGRGYGGGGGRDRDRGDRGGRDRDRDRW